jgi:hypothetical protein
MVVTKKSDGSVVPTPAWIRIESHQTDPYLVIDSNDVSHEGIYIVTIKSKLYNESDFSP